MICSQKDERAGAKFVSQTTNTIGTFKKGSYIGKTSERQDGVGPKLVRRCHLLNFTELEIVV